MKVGQNSFFSGTGAGGGTCTCLGAKAGDTVVRVQAIIPGSGISDVSFRFATSITNNDQIQQLTSTPDMSSWCLVASLV